MTGWNMPPGCNVSDIPGWDDDGITVTQEKVLEILEKAGFSQKACDTIMELMAAE